MVKSEYYAEDKREPVEKEIRSMENGKYAASAYIYMGREFMRPGEKVIGISVEIEGIPVTLIPVTANGRCTIYKGLREAFGWDVGDTVTVEPLGRHIEER